MADDNDTVELRLARAYRDEAEQIKKAAEQDLEAARYERGQADFRQRTAEDHNRAAGERVRWLEEHDEAKVRAIVAAADDKLKQAQELMASYDAAKHGAAIALVQINEREQAEQSAA
jgi:hypothetical protein